MCRACSGVVCVNGAVDYSSTVVSNRSIGESCVGCDCGVDGATVVEDAASGDGGVGDSDGCGGAVGSGNGGVVTGGGCNDWTWCEGDVA